MWLDVLLILLIAAALFLALRKLFSDRRQGKGCCGACSACDRCRK